MLNIDSLFHQGANNRAATKSSKGGGCGSRGSSWDATNYVRSLDSFAKDIPAFNIAG